MTMMKLKLPDLLMGGDLEKTASGRGWRSLWIYIATGGGGGKGGRQPGAAPGSEMYE
jgi:hypothetical protein